MAVHLLMRDNSGTNSIRAPFHVLIFPYKFEIAEPIFLIPDRTDNGEWQAISGGGEEQESLLEAAKKRIILRDVVNRY